MRYFGIMVTGEKGLFGERHNSGIQGCLPGFKKWVDKDVMAG